MKNYIVTVSLFLVLVGHVVAETRIPGVVFGVSGDEIEILIPTNKSPNPGTPVEIFETADDGTRQTMGLWHIVRAELNMAYAQPDPSLGQPKPGQNALIGEPEKKAEASSITPLEEQKVPAKKPTAVPLPLEPEAQPVADETIAQKKPEQPPKVALKKDVQLSPEDQKLLDDLLHEDAVRVRSAAKYLYAGQYENSFVMDKAADVLQKRFNQNTKDPMHVDAMAWICKALWRSGNTQYLPVLQEVEKKASSPKLRKYALKFGNALKRKTR